MVQQTKNFIQQIPGWIPLAIIIFSGGWNLSSRLTKIEDRQAETSAQVNEIAKYLKIPAPIVMPQSYTDGDDTPTAKAKPPKRPLASLE